MRAALLAVFLASCFLALRAALPDFEVRRHLRRQVRRRRRPWEEAEPRRTVQVRLRLPARLTESPWHAWVTRHLEAAGLDLYPPEALLAWAGLSVLLLLALLGALGWAAALVAPVLAGLGGVGLLRVRARQRAERLSQALPEALQLLAQGIRSGHSLQQSLEMVARETPEPLGGEFARLVQALRVSVPLEEALQECARRIGTREAELLATAVTVQRQVGGNLADVLDRIQDTLRERLRVEGEVRALTAQGRLSGAVIGSLPPGLALLASILDPGFLAPLFDTGTGRALLLLSCLWEAVGLYTIQRLVRVDF
jgi:tight adherence protein B